jgi:hypothetical protein
VSVELDISPRELRLLLTAVINWRDQKQVVKLASDALRQQRQAEAAELAQLALVIEAACKQHPMPEEPGFQNNLDRMPRSYAYGWQAVTDKTWDEVKKG